jgi:AcrR family transcriptional regulator
MPEPGSTKAAQSMRKRRGIGRPRAGAAHAVGRETLIATACELLTRLPPSQVTRARVAEVVGVDPSLIRYYFRDRSTLLLAAFQRLTTDYLTMADDDSRVRHHATPEESLRARVVALLRLNFKYPYFHQLVIDEIATMDVAAAREQLQRLTDRGLAGYADILHEGVKDGSLRAVDNAMLFIAVIGMTQFFVSGQAIVKTAIGARAYDEKLMETYGNVICDVLLHGLQGRKQ